MRTILVRLGVFIVIAMALMAGAAHFQGQRSAIGGDTAEAQPTYVPTSETPQPDTCSRADSYRNEAMSSFNAHAYRDAYRNAVSGLAVNETCTDESDQLVNHGYLLATKGLAEHYLTEGDWRTDLNQAGMLLEQCVTKPGLYATAIGAGCQTEQEAVISWKTGWDMGQ
jgi:hypothetical protein